jgi:hypothetical protein
VTGARRPTPPACIYTALEENPGDGWTDYADVERVAQAVWDALLAAGMIAWRDPEWGYDLADRFTYSMPQRVLVVPLDADEENTKEEHDGSIAGHP